jgi:hypothetical protein
MPGFSFLRERYGVVHCARETGSLDHLGFEHAIAINLPSVYHEI